MRMRRRTPSSMLHSESIAGRRGIDNATRGSTGGEMLTRVVPVGVEGRGWQWACTTTHRAEFSRRPGSRLMGPRRPGGALPLARRPGRPLARRFLTDSITRRRSVPPAAALRAASFAGQRRQLGGSRRRPPRHLPVAAAVVGMLGLRCRDRPGGFLSTWDHQLGRPHPPAAWPAARPAGPIPALWPAALALPAPLFLRPARRLAARPLLEASASRQTVHVHGGEMREGELCDCDCVCGGRTWSAEE